MALEECLSELRLRRLPTELRGAVHVHGNHLHHLFLKVVLEVGCSSSVHQRHGVDQFVDGIVELMRRPDEHGMDSHEHLHEVKKAEEGRHHALLAPRHHLGTVEDMQWRLNHLTQSQLQQLHDRRWFDDVLEREHEDELQVRVCCRWIRQQLDQHRYGGSVNCVRLGVEDDVVLGEWRGKDLLLVGVVAVWVVQVIVLALRLSVSFLHCEGERLLHCSRGLVRACRHIPLCDRTVLRVDMIHALSAEDVARHEKARERVGQEEREQSSLQRRELT
mmetsp:Transcript_10224/g.41633  ORF Transcript_10224/g.41633 Transcript_10224/m.41633 type:complete len:275 (+) Transcript_10224:975-1799(+)